MRNEYTIADLEDVGVLSLNEVFPNAFEILTHALMKIGGSIGRLDQLARQSKVELTSIDHPNFARLLQDLITRGFDWKKMLWIYSQGNKDLIGSSFEGRGEAVHTALMQALLTDELFILKINEMMGKGRKNKEN
ncbi:hypothetical protein HY469_05975 [Candidatus Roizmanbacteria bacterium]|nr:hypothetical protein [Candidatus Roizmanbacteria bacterium]